MTQETSFRCSPWLGAVALFVALMLGGTAAWADSRLEAANLRSKTFAEWMPLAEAGDAEAQCNIGVAFLNGDSVPQDFRRGLHWLQHASAAGFGYARYVLADVYSRGYAGVPIDDEKAYYFAVLAAASSSLPEKYREKATKIRDACAKRLTPAQVTRVQGMTALAPLDAVASGS